MPITNVVAGFVLLLFGRRVFWLFVGLAGFLVGVELARDALPGADDVVILAIAVGAGLLGALLAVVLERLAFALAGFYAGGYLSILAARSFAIDIAPAVIFVAGGIAGLLVAWMLLDWALIVLSSLVGAGAIVAAVETTPTLRTAAFALLSIVGIAFQARGRS